MYDFEENSALLHFLQGMYGGDEVLVMGDFNLPTLKWPLEDYDDSGVRSLDSLYRDCFVELGCTQWVYFGTFVGSDNVLDLVFISDEDRLVDI